MKIRKHCYSIKDYKFICIRCGGRFFSSSKPYKEQMLVSCPHCYKIFEVDFSENKKWYGEHDGKFDIYDCFYLGDCSHALYEEIQQDLIRIFGEVKFEDASDGIHGKRIGITLRENKDIYYKEIIKNGFANISFNFNLLCTMESQKVKKILKELKEEKEHALPGN